MAVLFDKQNPFLHTALIEGVIFDNDGTLYHEPENAPEYHTQAAVSAVKTQLSYRSIQEIEYLMGQSRKQYGGALDIFEHEYGLDMLRLRRDHYHNLVELTRETTYFEGADTPERGLSTLKSAGVNLYIATHGNEEWTDYSLESNRLSHLFSAAHDNVIHKDDVPGHHGKNQSPAMYAALLDKIGVPDTELPWERGVNYAMVEDTVANLKQAKALGMMTVLIDESGKVDPATLPDYVDIVIRDRNDIASVILVNNYLHHEEDLLQEHGPNWSLGGEEGLLPAHLSGHHKD
ncbi:MAG: HAD family hydrolase [Alphaproteobacteria bacterium]|nr:HAD family hydrolase [Alphaproteobacteria bacterium]MCB1839556.1 HAD family hydrolase [Alphaproteobacteria bacterium]